MGVPGGAGQWMFSDVTVDIARWSRTEQKPVVLLLHVLRIGSDRIGGEWVLTRDLLNYSSLSEKPKNKRSPERYPYSIHAEISY